MVGTKNNKFSARGAQAAKMVVAAVALEDRLCDTETGDGSEAMRKLCEALNGMMTKEG